MNFPTTALYSTASMRALDAAAIAASGEDAYALMDKAGAATWRRLRVLYSESKKILVCAGPGNNGGDGYVLARYALLAQCDVLLLLASKSTHSGAAKQARDAYLSAGGREAVFSTQINFNDYHVTVDAIFGIGLTRAPEGFYAQMIAAINSCEKPVVSCDLPSGLNADTGLAYSPCVHANLTVSYIAQKQGLFTGEAAAHAGCVVLESLNVDCKQFAQILPDAYAFDRAIIGALLKPRIASAHKGMFGHVLAVGGDLGCGGAIKLCAEAALRSGAGLVSVATRNAHLGAIIAARSEVMAKGVESAAEVLPLLKKASVVALGPGLGQLTWGRELCELALTKNLPSVIDADALNLIAAHKLAVPSDSVLTPHPGEAARLLGCSTAEINQDRFASVRAMAKKFNAVVLLKGAGTLVANPDGKVFVHASANPAMATAGMGDVLTGIIAALLAQRYSAMDAACLGVAVHAQAAQLAAQSRSRGVLASDVIEQLSAVVNP